MRVTVLKICLCFIYLMKSVFILVLNCIGMEGSPVFGECSDLIGLLTRPLRQKNSGTEIQVYRNHSCFLLYIMSFLKDKLKCEALVSFISILDLFLEAPFQFISVPYCMTFLAFMHM